MAVALRVAGETRKPPPVPRAAPPAGFTEVGRHQGPTFTVVRYRADAPVTATPVLLGPLALEPGTPDSYCSGVAGLGQPWISQPSAARAASMMASANAGCGWIERATSG